MDKLPLPEEFSNREDHQYVFDQISIGYMGDDDTCRALHEIYEKRYVVFYDGEEDSPHIWSYDSEDDIQVPGETENFWIEWIYDTHLKKDREWAEGGVVFTDE